MKQYRITSENLDNSSPDDAYLPPDDPIQELKIVQYLAGLGSRQKLAEYKQKVVEMNTQDLSGSNISITGTEKAKIQRERGICPGTPEWFRLWFAKPFMTNEKPIDK